MCRLLRRFFITFRVKALFLTSLLFVLYLGHPFQNFLGTKPAVAQAKNPTQLIQVIQKGVEFYQQGDYSDAISRWEEAIAKAEKEKSDPAVIALIFENLARANAQVGKSENALENWQKAAEAYRQLKNNTQVGRMLTEQAQTLISLGQYERAIKVLCSPQSENQEPESLSSCKANSSLEISTAINDVPGQAAAHGTLAEAYRLQGEFQDAQTHADKVLELNLDQFEPQILNVQGKIHANLAQIAYRRAEASKSLNLDEDTEKFRNTEKQEINQAIEKFTQSIEKSIDPESSLSANLNLLKISTLPNNALSNQSIRKSQEELKRLIRDLPESQKTAYAAIALANSYQPLKTDFACQSYSADSTHSADSTQFLEQARDIATKIEDGRALSFAFGQLGHMYECQEDWQQAQTLTERAQRSAGPDLESADSLYLWEWQMGRIYQKRSERYKARQKQSEREKALGFYERAVTTLDKVRSDIISADRDLQFDFRDSSVEPLYRQYIKLQLDSLPIGSESKVIIPNNTLQKKTLNNSLKILDSLRLAELQNFFGDDCVLELSDDVAEKQLSNGSKTVVISSIDFSDQTALIARFPDGESILAKIPYEMEIMEPGLNLHKTINDYIQQLNEFYRLDDFNTQSAEALYDKLLGPFQKKLDELEELEEKQDKKKDTLTLVLVHDHLLRRVPMAGLYSGKEYLAQKYALASTPSLSLTIKSEPRSASPKILAMGLTEETKIGDRTFGGLRYVEEELNSIKKVFTENRTTTLLNTNFTAKRFEEEISNKRFSVVHFATHGQFSLSPEDSFLVTGISNQDSQGKLKLPDDRKDSKLTFDVLEDKLRNSNQSEPIDLITLSACQTASGDNRSTLGLAGIAIRSGARSALASFSVLEDNAASQLIKDFYKIYLDNTKLSKAQVLQEVQKNAIEKEKPVHPGIWSQLVLVGNWQ